MYRIQDVDPKRWPPGIRPLTFGDYGLEIDRDGILYWDGKPVMIRRKFELRWYELILATIATIATATQAAAALIGLQHP